MLPGQLGIGTFSPPLDERGNSVRGIKVCEDLSARLGLHMFDAGSPAGSVLARSYRGDQAASKRLRPTRELAVLAQEGRGLVVFELRGALNLAAAERVTRAVTDELERIDGRVVLLDCRRVGAIDTAAAGLLVGIARVLAERLRRANQEIRVLRE